MTTPHGAPGDDAYTREAELPDSLVQLSFAVQAVLTRVAEAHGLSVAQTRMLAVLLDREIGMLRLARILELEKSSVTGLVDRAERRGLVERLPVAGNRRAVNVMLTPTGRELITTVRRGVHHELAHFTGPLAPGSRQALQQAAASLLENYTQSRSIPV